jgi:ABC-type dipeptide/oligopeptide/nickel transport system permease subunit
VPTDRDGGAGATVLPAAPLTRADGLVASRSRLAKGWRRLTRRPPALVASIVVLLFVGLAAGAPWLAPDDPTRTDWRQIRKAPTWAHPFGTDDLGRDNLSRVIWGSRISMRAGVLAILFAMAIGVPVGLISGYYRGAIDLVIMRLTDAWLAFPFLILAIGLVTLLGPSLTNATLAIGLGATPTFLRLTRGLVLATREEDYVQGARALGAGDPRVMARHVLPNIVSSILVQATVSIPAAIIGEAILSFLGLGVQPPAPSWGTMLNAAQQFLETAPWMAWWPGLAIFLLTLSFNLAGDGLRDVLDPKDY